jgi:hypothetical protein
MQRPTATFAILAYEGIEPIDIISGFGRFCCKSRFPLLIKIFLAR